VAAGIKIIGNAASALPPLNGDEHLVKEMLTTLLNNTVTNGKPGDALLVRADVSNTGGLYISVKDTGVGIVAGDAGKAPEPPGNAKPTEADDPGVGLSLCRSIAELHGGRLEVVHDAGGGVTVTAHFPAIRTVTPEKKPAEQKPSWSLTSRSVV
jgi:two-component system cell cycle sensor histidine kinase PleC